MGTTSKALSLLDLFSRTRPEIGLTEMARLSGANKATVHRLLGELAAHGFVEQVGSGRAYRLGPAFLRLAALRERHVPLREIAARAVGDLARETGETAHLSLLQGDVLATLAFAYGDAHGTQVRMEDAEVLTFHATSSGLAVLAFSPPGFIARALAAPLTAHTVHTQTDAGDLRAALPGIRARGLAESVGSFEEDVHSHAAPLFDSAASCIGALAVAAPVSRMEAGLKARIEAALPRHAARFTRLTGGFPPDDFPTSEPRIPAMNEV